MFVINLAACLIFHPHACSCLKEEGRANVISIAKPSCRTPNEIRIIIAPFADPFAIMSDNLREHRAHKGHFISQAHVANPGDLQYDFVAARGNIPATSQPCTPKSQAECRVLPNGTGVGLHSPDHTRGQL